MTARRLQCSQANGQRLGVFVDVAWDLARWVLRTALLFERAYIAVELAGAIQERLALVHCAARSEPLNTVIFAMGQLRRGVCRWTGHLGAAFVCRICGHRGADVRPDFDWERRRGPSEPSPRNTSRRIRHHGAMKFTVSSGPRRLRPMPSVNVEPLDKSGPAELLINFL